MAGRIPGYLTLSGAVRITAGPPSYRREPVPVVACNLLVDVSHCINYPCVDHVQDPHLQ